MNARSSWFSEQAEQLGQARLGDDPAAYDPSFAAAMLDRLAPYFGHGRYFELDVQGLHDLSDAPHYFVANHSGGTTTLDVFGLGLGWYEHQGVHRPLHGLAHELVFAAPPAGRFFSRLGAVRASRPLARRILVDHQRDMVVFPGGDRDVWRPYAKRYQVHFAGRTGYARIALELGVPITPVAHVGAHSTFVVLTDGVPVARALGIQRLARASIFPVHLSFPFGLTVGPWPHLPPPTTLRYRFGKPVPLPATHALGDAVTDEAVAAYDASVRAALQAELDILRAQRQAPLPERMQRAAERLLRFTGR